ncbi:SusC/RagA family TonB-linked outer membrane protein [Flavobacterium hydrophilum]|uniref:SusC/RagA family TonB-linked outer membrane protein n=1 Tax=Flavobacterium hydrophilum TaxID=2211445 RepID=A0A2V4BY28_9FLAO|nr:SusC/RagA family TonB-linked outer membrane protein [Flavobacterium hydrophilum]PXY43901.1 SusC/RagA family TonB-linked outer membrane protein [Flavobacterium hydrophilum]
MKQALIKRCSFILFALMSIVTNAQTASSQIKITGTVTDNTGLLLPGVNVTEKSSKNTVTTDYSGRYEISVKPGATLVFSFIGMKKIEVPLNGRTNLDAKLQEDSNVLDDIVVVAYGKQKKNNVTGAIVTIKPDEIRDLPVSNLSEALRGLSPGVNVNNANGSSRPGGAADITIRQSFGFTNATSQFRVPLIVIDDMVQIDPQTGLPTQEAFNRLDPSEIENITILKDGSAAIYGARASQGAIIVKTKRGKEGKAKFTYYSQFAVNDAVSHQKTMSAYEHGVWKNRFLSSNLEANQAKYFSEDELEQMKSLDYDWLKKAWKPAIQQRHVLNVSGGTDKVTYFAGGAFFTQGANLGDQDYEKWNFRTGTTVKVTNNLEFSASVSGTSTDTQKSFTKASANLNDAGSFGSLSAGEQADYMYLLHMPKYIPWQTTVAGKEYWMSPIARSDANLGSANNRGTLAGWNYFAALQAGKQTDEDFAYNVNLNMTYKVPFVKGMSIKGSYARSQSSASNEQVQLPFDLARIRNYETIGNHLASAADPTVYDAVNNPNGDYLIETNSAQSRVYYNSDVDKMIQSNIFVNYNRTFGDHAFDAMVGVERSELNSRSLRLAYEGTGKDYLGDYTSAGPISNNSTAMKTESGTLSYLGRLNYGYKDKYLAEFIFRSDASTKFAPKNYWGFFPGAQFGWVMSKEKWFTNNVSWVNNLKLRYSIGKSGKDAIQPWLWQQFYEPVVDRGAQFGSQGGTLGTGITPRPTPNSEVRWDASLKQNYGIDVALLNNRLQISVDYYYNKNTEMLVDMAGIVGTPITVGGALAEQNYGAVNDWGTEFSINWNDKIKDKFSYNVGVNFGFNDNEIKEFPLSAPALESANVRRVGQSSYTPVWGFRTWKETSSGDGILRTDEDIANYWQYLTERAAAVGGTPGYIGNITNVSNMRKGMLAYQDVGGVFNATTGEQAPADGKIATGEDYVKLVNSNRTYGFTTNLGFKYDSFYFKTQIATSWGGYNAIDLVKQGIATSSSGTHNDWSHEVFWTDMYDATTNPDGKYPNMYQTANFNPSDFWQLNNFRCVVRNLSVGYALPKEALKTAKIDGISFGITGQNLWDLYNPYPKKYRNMYDDSTTKYPTLRTWSLSMNVTF